MGELMLYFREINIEDAELIVRWRTSQRVDSMMLSSISNQIEDQIKWLTDSFEKEDYYHWIIYDETEDIGLVSINRFNLGTESTSWGYYIGEERKLGAGATVPAYFYNFIFSEKSPIKTVTAEILETNPKVIRMHQIYGYVSTPELDAEITRGGVPQRLVTMELSKDAWASKTEFHGFTSDFPMTKWGRKPKSYF